MPGSLLAAHNEWPSPIMFESRSNVAAIGTDSNRKALQAAVDSRQHRDNAVDL
jgi:hypothetical protein